jgi:hypothetical protein
VLAAGRRVAPPAHKDARAPSPTHSRVAPPLPIPAILRRRLLVGDAKEERKAKFILHRSISSQSPRCGEDFTDFTLSIALMPCSSAQIALFRPD